MAGKKKPSESTKVETKSDQSKGEEKGVVQVRQVVTKPLSLLELLSNETKDVADENPNAPDPIPSQQFKAQLKQMRRTHRRTSDKKKPTCMSDIKI